MRRFVPPEKLLRRTCYNYYRKNKVPKIAKKYAIADKVEYNVIVKTIWNTVAKHLIEKKGGVLLHKFGYLCHWVTPKKLTVSVSRKGREEIMTNYFTKGYWYNTSLFTDVFPRHYLDGWQLERSFSPAIKKARGLALKKGMKYKCYYTFLKAFYKRQNYKET